MPEPQKDLSLADAKKVAGDAIKSGAVEVKVEKQADAKWTVTVTPAD